ncbi:MAG: tryptophan--tRNA ligase [Pseudomonadota bacterium]
MRILSGIQPSGRLHIGNYFGMMKPMIGYQERGELFAFIVDYHALTSIHDGGRLAVQTIEAAVDFLALGLDPERATFWVQSDLPEVCELSWILGCVTPMGLLERSHAYKDKVARGLPASAGLFTYPVLMAADILLCQANLVPVGEDQRQHLEIARDVAIKFNSIYGECLVVPEAEVKEVTVPGTDGRKMSKSYGNTIEIFAERATLKSQVMGIVTDSLPVEAPKDSGQSTLYALYRFFSTPEEAADLADRFRAGGLRYSGVKKDLVERIWKYFEPHREKRRELAAHPQMVRDALAFGAGKARKVIGPTIEMVRRKVGVAY